jgi:hypothetical protein
MPDYLFGWLVGNVTGAFLWQSWMLYRRGYYSGGSR